jgi:hypothetical protein
MLPCADVLGVYKGITSVKNGRGCLEFAWGKQNKRQVVKPWKPPASDFVKVNIEGAFDERTCKGWT